MKGHSLSSSERFDVISLSKPRQILCVDSSLMFSKWEKTPISDQMLDNILKMKDSDKDGKLSFDEFFG